MLVFINISIARSRERWALLFWLVNWEKGALDRISADKKEFIKYRKLDCLGQYTLSIKRGKSTALCSEAILNNLTYPQEDNSVSSQLFNNILS